MIISKYLQKLFFLLMVGGALCTLQACGDDEEDEPVQKPNEEETVKPDDGKEEEKPSDKPSDTMEAVDLGLPSGTLWATCNVGASSPEEYGGYYAWGETEEKEDYSWETYKWCKGTNTSMIKYCTKGNYGTVDNKTVLELSDDVAHINKSESWRMPSQEEFEELCQCCTWEWNTNNGVNGQLVTGPNGNSIFLPAGGFKSGMGIVELGEVGYYWSTPLYKDHSDYACVLNFYDGYHYSKCWTSRKSGHLIRPVQSRQQTDDSSSKKEHVEDYTGIIEGHHYVDLGLSVKWATCNVGSSSPAEYGNYYAWGEIEIKDDYSWNTYKWNKGISGDVMNKYCTDGDLGIVDNYKVLELSDDIANVEWGGKWRIPTQEEWNELNDACSWIRIDEKGQKGYRIIGPNENSIFLPATGFRYDMNLGDCGSSGFYWSATLNNNENKSAYNFAIYNSYWGLYSKLRCYGLAIRPVCD